MPAHNAASVVDSEPFATLWGDAFDVYEHRTGIDLRDKSSDIALRLHNCDSEASVLDALQRTAAAFGSYREGGPKWSQFRQKLKPVITAVTVFIEAAAEGAASAVCYHPQQDCNDLIQCICVVCARGQSCFCRRWGSVEGASAIFAGPNCLDLNDLQATQGVSEKFDALVDLLESLGLFLRQLKIRSDVPFGNESKIVVVEILVEVLKALSLATQMMKQNRISRTTFAIHVGEFLTDSDR
jgi:hypothetical protein